MKDARDIWRYAIKSPIEPEDWLAIEAAMIRTARVAGPVRGMCADFARRMRERGTCSEWRVAEEIVLLGNGRLWHVEEDEEASDWWVAVCQQEIESSLACLDGGDRR
jgi:hypothetical protein